jgi:hypothetical protein
MREPRWFARTTTGWMFLGNHGVNLITPGHHFDARRIHDGPPAGFMSTLPLVLSLLCLILSVPGFYTLVVPRLPSPHLLLFSHVGCI